MLTAQDIKRISAVVATKKDFAKIDHRLAVLEKRLANTSTKKEVTTLGARISGLEIAVIGVQRNLETTNKRLDSFEARFEHMINSVDRLAGAFEDLRLEYVAVSTQLSRHEEWIKEIAKKAGIKLEY